MLLNKKQRNRLKRCAKSRRYTPEDIALLTQLISTHIDLMKLLKDPNTSLEDVYQYLERDENPTSPDNPAGNLRASRGNESDA